MDLRFPIGSQLSLSGNAHINTIQSSARKDGDVTQARETQTQQHEDSDAFVREIAGRTAHANKAGKTLAEKSNAMSVVLGYFSPRTVAQFQILNKRFYDHVIPTIMGQLPFQNYPVKRSPILRKGIWDPKPRANDRILKLTSEKNITVSSEKLFPLLKIGPCQQFVGWLTLCGTVPNTASDPEEVDEVTTYLYQGYRNERTDTAKSDKIRLSYWLGKKLFSYYCMPGDGWKIKKITDKEHTRIGKVYFEKSDHLSIMDIFNDRPRLPNALRQEIQSRLDQEVKKNVISKEERARALSNLEPVSKHFAEGSMVADLVIVPKMIDGQEKNYVYMECTPKDQNHLQSRQIFMTENIVMDADNNIRLSDKLKKNVQLYFQKMGWDNCLGKTLCLKPEDSVLNTSNLSEDSVLNISNLSYTAVDGTSDQYEDLIDCNNKNLKTLEKAFLLFSNNRAISNDPKQTPYSKAQAECNMKEVKDGIYRWAQNNIKDIDPKAFKDLMDRMTNKVSIVTYSECSLQVLEAIKESLKMQTGSVQDFQKFKEMLNACREKPVLAIRQCKINTAEDTVAYLLVNELNTTITALSKKIAAHEGVPMHRSGYLEEEEKTGS